MAQFGFLGLGIMGSAMAANLVKAGFEVTVWNRSAEKTRPLQELGARVGRTPQEVTTSCPVTFAMLADPEAATAVCFAPEGALAGIGAGRGYVDMSTVDAATARRIGEAVRNRGGRFLEAPVSGTRKPAEEGTLIILAAGDRDLYEKALPGLERMGKKIMFLGETGNGAKMKLVVNLVMGGMMTAFCEGLALGERSGLRPVDILEVLDSGAMANPMFRIKGGLMLQGNYAASFPLKHMQKDLRLALLQGDEARQPLFTVAAANELFKQAGMQGLNDEDFSAVFKAIKGLD